MTDLLLFLLATYGLTALIIEGRPTKYIRDFLSRLPGGDHLVQCYLCMGFWCSLTCWGLLCFKLHPTLWVLAGTGVAYIIHNIAPEKGE